MTLLFLSTYILAAINQYLYNQQRVELLANANVVANVVSEYIEEDRGIIGWLISQLNVAENTRVIITNKHAEVIYDSNSYSDVQGKVLMKEEITSALLGNDTVSTTKTDEIGNVLEGAVTVLSDSEIIGAVYISQTMQETEDFLENIRWILVVISIVVCLLISVLSWVMADIIISPIETLTQFVSSFNSSTMNKRIKVTGRDEISELANAFNNMADRLEEMEEKRRQFVSNASHELKTPLSSIKLLSESILSVQTEENSYIGEFMTDINGEVDRLAKIVDRLLTLTKMDAGTDVLDTKLTCINELLERVSRSLKPQADRKNIAMAVIDTEQVYAEVDAQKMWQVIYNLTDNAIKYTPAGGVVKLTLKKEGEFCRIEISDNGIGIPESDVDRVFDRFYRVDKARSRESGGTGLGLSIVKDVVELHKGKILVDSKEGAGSTFIIILPLRQHADKEETNNE